MGCLGFWALFFIKYCFYSKYEFISSGSYFSLSFLSPVLALRAFLLWAPVILGSWRVAEEVGEGVVITAGSFAIFFPIQDTRQGIYNGLCFLRCDVPSWGEGHC